MAAISGFGNGGEFARGADNPFSGVKRGNCIGHLPEAAERGPIALPRDGDMITLEPATSAPATSEEFKRRKRDWAPRETQIGSGMDWMFAQQASAATEVAMAACGKGAKECHADIWG